MFKIIFFFGSGRLGNQLFQYCFIRSFDKSTHYIISSNFKELLQLFETIPNVINLQNKILNFVIRKLLVRLLEFLAVRKLISSVSTNVYIESGFQVADDTLIINHGFLPILYVYPQFYQSEKLFDKATVEKLEIKKEYLECAESFLEAVPKGFERVFVHIRRSDYFEYSALGEQGVALPLHYYLSGINWYQQNVKNPFFIFLTDDPEFVEHSFADIKNQLISKNSLFVDFCIISLCDYGVMSNSSFSWWAAYMMKNKKKIFFPKYWLGWKNNVEYPKGIKPSFADEIIVTKI